MGEPTDFYATETWTAGIIGLGYVGLPLAITATNAGLPVIGLDIDATYVDRLRAGSSPIEDVPDEQLAAALAAGLEVTTDTDRLGDADAIFICVPSPLGRNREPDLSYIKAAAETIRRVAHPNLLVALESTTYPGTTEDVIVPVVLDAGLTLDQNVWVAFSPERVSPGDELKIADIPKVVGGVTPASTAVATAAYERLVASVHPVSSAAAAEMAKLLENTYRAVNIGLANEMSQLADALGIDIWEVIDAAATKPFGFQAFYPGPGVGGHCIPLDPQFLAWRAREANFATRFIDLAEQVNVAQPGYTANRIGALMNEHRLPVNGSEILGVGIAYKPNIADDRESASIEVLRELEGKGAIISVLDPVVGRKRIEETGFVAVDPGDDLSRFALAAVLTDHDDIDYAALAAAVPIVFDARGTYRARGLSAPNVHAL
ncbi:MAG: nucleotide sugar dehydrogenase [Acidobacteria bacterium]|nr:nucleotide sugar dehydrogenase [Acidobacteriota bacterium]